MENLELEQKNINIASVETLVWGFKVSDEHNLKYNISQYKKGTKDETVAYKSISALNKNGLGMTKCFKFVTVPNSQGGKSRYVRIIGEPEEAQYVSDDMKSSEYPGRSLGANTATPQEEKIKPRDYDAEAFGKCKHAFLVEAFKKIYMTDDYAREYLNIEVIAEEWAIMSMKILPKDLKNQNVGGNDQEVSATHESSDMPTGDEPENQPSF